MRIATSYLLTTYFVAQIFCGSLYSEPNESNNPTQLAEPVSAASATVQETQAKPAKPFTAFTGRTLKNKVRIRLQPSLDAPILREISKGDLFVVVGETDDFFAIDAPDDIKGYVFRTYVLDNVIEGNRVNVRLEPNLEAPVIAQLSAGEKVDGQVSALNSKWLEITPPPSARFYIAKEYVEKIGNPSVKVALEEKRKKGIELLSSTMAASQVELQKPWNQINLDEINENLNILIKDYSDFPDLQAKAKQSQTILHETYFQKKIAYLETISKNTDFVTAQNKELAEKLAAQEQRINELQQVGSTPSSEGLSPPPSYSNAGNSVDRMNSWIPIENLRYESWSENHENQPISSFYDEQLQNATTLKGVVEVYDRSVRNKPGDYVLLNPTTRIPTAYLYSTLVNLQDYAGKEVTIKAAPRDNNNFAYPAFFVISVQ